MFGLLQPGERRLAFEGQVVGVEVGALEGLSYMTTVYLDFGLGFAMAGLDLTVEEFRTIDGPGNAGDGTGSGLGFFEDLLRRT